MELLGEPLTAEQKKRLKRRGIDVDKLPKDAQNNGYAMMAGQIASAIGGDTPAAKFVAELIGEYSTRVDLDKLKIEGHVPVVIVDDLGEED